MPHPVKRAIEKRADELGYPVLKRAAAEMSAAYRDHRPSHLNEEERAAAYLVTRMPATYAAAYAVLREIRERAGDVSSILDVGSGTGAASLAARQWFPNASITMIERDSALSGPARLWLPDAQIITADVKRLAPLPPADLVIAAWSLGEFGAAVARRMWTSARVAMLAIEPGTPRGFALIRSVRDELLAAGAHMIAPCPGAIPCPVSDSDWCHFAARVERTSLHRRIKGGDLGHEDEKFSYIALAKNPATSAAARIVRRPHQSPGLITIQICAPAGLQQQDVRKRDRDLFRTARHAAWGDAWEPDQA